ncbi:MAG: hypothetical protein A2X64_07120 [Ignavibacteria bacterium GWF2_33_9]|nr:MAG: hypothetical protein A2X64_07120 [Ignavibacteria bacterium GWF2_33_9]
MVIFFSAINVKANWEKDLFSYLQSLEGERLENNYLLAFYTGIGKCSDNFLTKNLYIKDQQTFAPIFNLWIEYGFKRYDNTLKLKNYYLQNGERVFFGNSSSHFKPDNWEFNGQTIDSWKFGLSTTKGIGIRLFENYAIEFQNQNSLVWNRIDFEYFFKKNIIDPVIQRFDEKYRFGSDYSAAIIIPVTSNFSLDVQYQRNLIFPEWKFSKWFGSYILENGARHCFDYFDQDLFDAIGSDYYLYKFLYQAAVSFLFTELKRGQTFTPFNSSESLLMQYINIRFTFVKQNN